jgi:hypothetical protein
MEYTLENAEGQSKTEHRIYAKIATDKQYVLIIRSNTSTLDIKGNIVFT